MRKSLNDDKLLSGSRIQIVKDRRASVLSRRNNTLRQEIETQGAKSPSRDEIQDAIKLNDFYLDTIQAKLQILNSL